MDAIGKRIDDTSMLDALASMTKFISRESLESFARSIVQPGPVQVMPRHGVSCRLLGRRKFTISRRQLIDLFAPGMHSAFS